MLASLVSIRGQHGLVEPGPDAEWSELSTNLTLLFLGSLAAQALSYSAALGVLVLAQGKVERDAAADFIVGFFIARIPILLFQAIQAALLPKLAALSGRGQARRLPLRPQEAGDDRASAWARSACVAGATIGPTVGEILFGDKFNLDSRDLTLLFLGSAAFIFALTLAQALIALLGHGRALIAWAVGPRRSASASWRSAARPPSTTSSSGSSSATSPGAYGAALMMAVLPARLRCARQGPASLSLLVEAIEHEPLEI